MNACLQDPALVPRPKRNVDSFAGGGGVTEGVTEAGLTVHAAINHSRIALAMHRANHPQTRHYCEDVWDVDPLEVCDGSPVRLFWLSPDCTYHSRARAGKPRRSRNRVQRVRGLPWLANHWIKRLPMPQTPEVIMLENVLDFKNWGPLLPDGTPCPMRRGATFRRFVSGLQNRDYTVDWRTLRACDFGVPTSRERLFLIARRDGRPIAWPTPTHGPGLLPYRTAGEIIDWSLPIRSIFEPERKLVPATLRRIARGICRHVIETPDPYIVDVGAKCGGEGGKQLIGATLIQTSYGERPGQAPRVPGLNKPLGTIVAGGTKHALVVAFLTKYWPGPETRSGSRVVSIDSLTPTLRNTGGAASSASSGSAERVRAFLIEYYGTPQNPSLREPLRTVTTHDRFALVTVHGEQYRIDDIGMRLLTPRELFRAQGFPDSYIIDYGIDEDETGRTQRIEFTRTQKVHLCGNSVPPPLVRALAHANLVAAPAELPRFATGQLF
jgi:DNA (cytosine-5)-methyltransferase 1